MSPANVTSCLIRGLAPGRDLEVHDVTHGGILYGPVTHERLERHEPRSVPPSLTRVGAVNRVAPGSESMAAPTNALR